VKKESAPLVWLAASRHHQGFHSTDPGAAAPSSPLPQAPYRTPIGRPFASQEWRALVLGRRVIVRIAKSSGRRTPCAATERQNR
jgi:hypothetical protein